MTSTKKKNKFLSEVRDYEYRHEFVSANIVNGLAFQIGLMRDAQEWTQDELAERCGQTYESISRLEDPNDERYSLKTLLQLAKVFDVALLVRFAPFGELADWVINLNDEKLTPLSYEKEQMNLFSQVERDIEHDDIKQQYTWPSDVLRRADILTYLSSSQREPTLGDDVAEMTSKHDANNDFLKAAAA